MIEQLQGSDIHELFQRILAEVRGAWRYRWYGLAVAWGVFVLGALITFGLPNKYQASAEIYADTEALMNPLLHGIAVQPNVRNRLAVVTHTLLSRPNLETIAHKTGLSLRATSPEASETLIDKLAGEIDVKGAGTRDLYTISYEDPSRDMAKKVVQSLLQILMNDTLGANVQSTQTAQDFLQQQVADYSKKLNESEAKLAKFKKANIGYIPNQGGTDYITRLQNAEQQLQHLQDERSTQIAARSNLEQQMRGMTTSSNSSGVNPRIQAIDNQIVADQQKLGSLLLRYTAQYPDVVALKRMIVQLKARRSRLEKNAVSSSPMEVASSNPVYQDMQKALYTTQLKIETLAAEITLQKKQISSLKSRVGRLTDVQTTLQRLTRNYDITKKRYNELLSRLDTAQISQDASHTGNNLRFQVISPPIAPIVPVSPKRGLLIALALLMSLAMGGGFAFVLHKVRPVFNSLQSLRELGDYPALGALSLVVSTTQRRLMRRNVAGFAFGVLVLFAAAGLGLMLNGTISHAVHHLLGVTIS